MKLALQAILIASDDYQMKINVMTGYKNITIREGLRNYHVGPVMLCDEVDPWVVKANIFEVQHKTLADVTQEEWEADGFTSQEDMLTGMQHFYPTMTMDSPVTVIRWSGISGYWTEEENIEYFSKKYDVEAIL